MVKPIIKKGLEYAVDTLGNKIGALPSSNVLFDAYNIASKNKMVSKIKGVVEDMPNTMNLPYQIGQKLHSEGKLPLPIGTSLLPLGRKGYPDEVHKIIGHKGDIYNSDLYGYEIQAPNGDIFFQAISNPKLGLREQKADKVGSFTAALGPEGVAEMQFVPPSRSVRKSGALPQSFNDLRKGATIRIDNPSFLDVRTGETYVERKIRENNEYIEDLVKNYGKPREDITIGNVGGVTGFANNIKFSPQELIGIKGEAGEEKFRETGRRMELLKESIAKEGYRDADKGGERILIHVREDGVPFITEGNHRMVEAFQSNRPFISADIRYLRGAENVDGPLNPKRIGIDFGEE